jgi:hypothetical protein
MSDKPALDISTLPERTFVIVDGQPFPLLDIDDLSESEAQKLSRQMTRIGALMAAERDLTDDESGELDAALPALCRRILDAPEAVHAKLRPGHRRRILESFSELLLPPPPAAGAETPAGSTNSSPVSSASTGATR